MGEHNCYIQSYCMIRERSIYIDGARFLSADPHSSLGEFLRSAYRMLETDYPKFHKMDGLCKAVFIAVELMTRQTGPLPTDTALIFSNRSSSFLADHKHASDIFRPDGVVASPATFVYTLPNIAMGEISIRHQLHSENVFFIFDSYNPEFLAPYVNTLLHAGRAERVISGWTEVTEERCDLFLCVAGAKGPAPHTIEHLKRLYDKEHE
jgi:hypothetical protein